MRKFDRGIKDKFIRALNEEYAKDGWWRKIADDRQLFVGIRKNYLNVYYNGGSILELKHTSGDFTGKTHFKYLLNLARKSTRSPYVNFRNGAFAPVDLMDTFRDIGSDIESIKRLVSVRDHQVEEKKGVHKLIMQSNNVIDIEIQLPGDPEKRRIDFAALQRRRSGVKIVFFEAKTHSNSEIHVPLNRPAILDQVAGYRQLIMSRRAEIEESYRNVANNILEMKGWNDRRDSIFKEASQNGLCVDPDVRLVIFGFKEHEKNAGNKEGGVFSRLKKELGENCVLAKGSPKDLIDDISVSECT